LCQPELKLIIKNKTKRAAASSGFGVVYTLILWQKGVPFDIENCRESLLSYTTIMPKL